MRVEDLTDEDIALRPHRIYGPVADALLDRGAITPARAIPYAPENAAARRHLAQLHGWGAVRSTTDGRCWFDLRSYYLAQAKRERMRAMVAVPVAIIVALAATHFYRG